ncbi:MAG: hypothetical protein G01um101466_566 [Parcubacteria group bacterium Gr01-1014_66]|nr:MAG: hypothetical protein G01um101466_566 [Parcubacteria group bacterium Gr01-1014_66]
MGEGYVQYAAGTIRKQLKEVARRVYNEGVRVGIIRRAKLVLGIIPPKDIEWLKTQDEAYHEEYTAHIRWTDTGMRLHFTRYLKYALESDQRTITYYRRELYVGLIPAKDLELILSREKES